MIRGLSCSLKIFCCANSDSSRTDIYGCLCGLIFRFSRLHIHLEDTAKENISCHFMTAIEFIHKARSEGGERSE